VTRIRQLSATQLVGLAVAVVGLVLGVIAAATSTGSLGAIAGLLGVIGAVMATISTEPAPAAIPLTPNERTSPELLDEETDLFLPEVFDLLVDVRVTTAKRYLRPLAVVQLEVEADPLTPMTIEAVRRALTDTLRDCDNPCRLDDAVFGLILEDTPETGAVWAVERVRRHLQKQMPGTVLRAGIACYPAHSIEPHRVKELAAEALEQAKEWPQDRIEVAPAE